MYTAPTLNTGVPTVPNVAPNNSRYINNIPVDDDDDNIYEFTTRYSSVETEKDNNLIKPFTIDENIPRVS